MARKTTNTVEKKKEKVQRITMKMISRMPAAIERIIKRGRNIDLAPGADDRGFIFFLSSGDVNNSKYGHITETIIVTGCNGYVFTQKNDP